MSRLQCVLSTVVLVVFCMACGGSSSPAAPTPTPKPALPPVTVSQGSDSYQAHWFYRYPITTAAPGTLSLTVNWTFGSNQVGVGLAAAPCTVPDYQNGRCSFLAFDETPTSKPSRIVTIPSLPPGNYTVIISNEGTTDESISYLFTLQPS